VQNTKTGHRKLGALIYLDQGALSLSVEDFLSDFHRRWPQTRCEKVEEADGCTYFKIGTCDVVVQPRSVSVPDSVTNSVLDATLHWPGAKEDLSRHKAHIAVAASIETGDTLLLASVLTRTLVSLLMVTNSLYVCWLNGPVLSLKDDFVEVASELLELGQPPFLLWVGIGWKPEGGLVYTKGMAQFGVHEIFLAKQARLSDEIVTYLHDLVREVLASERTLAIGETIEGPNCFYKIDKLQGRNSNKAALFLVPTQPN
jgi:hypothetical protein